MNGSAGRHPYKISVALCTYNGARFLAEQLESFSAQTRAPDELVVCDDRSSDETPELVRRFAQKAGFPVTLHVNPENLGSTKNFEQAIQKCSGDVICLSDQDDIWLPRKIEVIEREFMASPRVGLVFSDAELIDDDSQLLNKRLWDLTFPPKRRARAKEDDLAETLLDGNVVTGATAAFRAVFAGDIIPIPTDIPNFIHDAWIALVISANAHTRFVQEPLILYRQHAGQQIGLHWGEAVSAEEYLELGIELRSQHRSALAALLSSIDRYPALMASDKIAQRLPIHIAAADDNIEHLKTRRRIRSSGFLPAGSVAREVVTGRYARYSRGIGTALKDLFRL